MMVNMRGNEKQIEQQNKWANISFTHLFCALSGSKPCQFLPGLGIMGVDGADEAGVEGAGDVANFDRISGISDRSSH
jgi:hypothetical protein